MNDRQHPSAPALERAAHPFERLFRPRSIAVLGASATGVTLANEFIRHSLRFGYSGKIYPIHPKADEVEGLRCYRSFAEIGEVVDYAYIGIGAEQVPALIESAAGRLRFAHVMSSGFGEVEEGRAREARLKAAAKAAGIRVLGPNCLGLHSPRGGITFVGGASNQRGSVGLVSQSGGLAVDMILRGDTRGLAYSAVLTIGNSVDLGPAELLEFFNADPETKVIGFYLEDVRDGRAFFEGLRGAKAAKPVVLLVGGQTAQGSLAAASHTGSLAADARIWSGLARQTGAVLTHSLEEFLDVLLAFQTLAPTRDRATRSAVLFGNGGGTSVLATDAFARLGLDVRPMGRDAVAALEALKLPPGTSVTNPIDTPAPTLRQEEGRIAERILAIVFEKAFPDAVVMHVNLPVFLTSANQGVDVVGNLVQAALRIQAVHPGQAHFVLVLRSDGAAATDERKRAYRRDAVKLGIPIYDEMTNAATGLAAIAAYERFVSSRGL